MDFRSARLAHLPVLAGAVAVGAVLEAAMDPYEPRGHAWIGLVLGLVAVAAVAAYVYRRFYAALDRPDERARAIERRASRLGHATLTVGLLWLAVALSLPWARDAVWPLAWVLLVGSIAVHEVSIEYYRRRM